MAVRLAGSEAERLPRSVRDAPRGRPVTSSDEALVVSIAGGDARAFGELYDRFGGLAYGLALRVVGEPAAAEDAVQDAFLSIWRSARTFDSRRGAARTWLLTLVHRRSIDLLRQGRRRRDRPTDAPPAADSASTAEIATLRAERRRVRAALESLPTKQRQALELAYYGGCSQSEIAERLGLPLGTIKSRVFAGLSALRALLEEP
jgi:RNA polymerase sigma-70 factor, ECF subfamily